MRVLHGRRGVALEAIARDAQTVGDRWLAERELLGLLPVEGALRARLVALRVHCGVERRAVERQLAFARQVLDEVQGQPEGVVKAEGLVARDGTASHRRAVEELFELRQATGEHGVESLL